MWEDKCIGICFTSSLSLLRFMGLLSQNLAPPFKSPAQRFTYVFNEGIRDTMRLSHWNGNYIKYITLRVDFRRAAGIDIIYKIIK